MTKSLRENIAQIGLSIESLNNHFYYLEASQDNHSAYAVFSEYANPSFRDTGSKFEEEYIQISLYGPDLKELELIAEDIKNTFGEGESLFAIDGFHLDRIERLTGPQDRKLNDIYQKIIQYKIELTKL